MNKENSDSKEKNISSDSKGKDKKLGTVEKKKNNIATYAVIMIVCVIVVILVAAMADNREEQIDSKIFETEKYNESIQNELVSLKDENYKLNKELQKNKTTEEDFNNYKNLMGPLNDVWNKISVNDLDGAKSRLITIDTKNFDEYQISYYNSLCKLLNINPDEIKK